MRVSLRHILKQVEPVIEHDRGRVGAALAVRVVRVDVLLVGPLHEVERGLVFFFRVGFGGSFAHFQLHHSISFAGEGGSVVRR